MGGGVYEMAAKCPSMGRLRLVACMWAALSPCGARRAWAQVKFTCFTAGGAILACQKMRENILAGRRAVAMHRMRRDEYGQALYAKIGQW